VIKKEEHDKYYTRVAKRLQTNLRKPWTT